MIIIYNKRIKKIIIYTILANFNLTEVLDKHFFLQIKDLKQTILCYQIILYFSPNKIMITFKE